ncbi:MAG: hypothetical protein JWR08_425 [Enterovirga sp.]|nr:hypothetical protein [Enterovirga sp.]
MPSRIRLEHKTLGERFHVFTSPDLSGFHVSGENYAETQREAIAVVDRIAAMHGDSKPIIDTIELADAA